MLKCNMNGVEFAQTVQRIATMFRWNLSPFAWWYLCKLMAVTVIPFIITGRNRHPQRCLKGQTNCFLEVAISVLTIRCLMLPAEDYLLKLDEVILSHANFWKHLVVHFKYLCTGRTEIVYFFGQITLALHLKSLFYPVFKIRALFF